MTILRAEQKLAEPQEVIARSSDTQPSDAQPFDAPPPAAHASGPQLSDAGVGRTFTLRVPGVGIDGIHPVRVTVTPCAEDIDRVKCDGRVLGYIYRTGRVYVALSGRRLDRAEECGQSLLWDKAAFELLREDHIHARVC